MEITSESVDLYMNMGGFMMIDTGRDKIHADEQFVASKRVCDKLELDGLVVAGDTTQTQKKSTPLTTSRWR